MPELPEVHTILMDLKHAGLVGRKIESVEVFWPKAVANMDAEAFCNALSHQKFVKLARRGKYLIFHLSSHLHLLVHLRMTGRLLLVPKETTSNSHIQLQFNLDGCQQLRFHDTRKFGRWYLVDNLDEVVGHMGPEPLSPHFTLQDFCQRLSKRARALKPLLLDQTFLAGLGNIYVDEALWEAQLHPLQLANQLTKPQIQKLYRGIIDVLKRGVDSQGTTLGTGQNNYYRLNGTRGNHQAQLSVFRRTGQACLRCGHSIEKLTVAQRSTHLCPICQSFSKG